MVDSGELWTVTCDQGQISLEFHSVYSPRPDVFVLSREQVDDLIDDLLAQRAKH